MENFQMVTTAKPRLTVQNNATEALTRPKVTICLYLNPNNSASSLSALIMVIVSKEIADKVVKVTAQIVARERQSPVGRFSFTKSAKYDARLGCKMRSTNKSVVARQRYKSLDGG